MTQPRILGELLAEQAGIDEAVLNAALGDERRRGERIGHTLLRLGAVTEDDVARALSTQLGIPMQDGALEPEEGATELVSPGLCAAHGIVPLSVEPRRIVLAMQDPLDLRAIDDVQFQTGRRVEPVVTTPGAIRRWAETVRPANAGAHEARRGVGTHPDNGPPTVPDGSVDPDGAGWTNDRSATSGPVDLAPKRPDFSELVAALPEELRTTTRAEADDAGELERQTRQAPVVRLVDRLLHRAIEDGASDLHVEETGSDVRVRARIDGVLRPTVDLPAGVRRAVLSRLKVIAGMDIAVRRRAQDGRISLRHEGRAFTLRVNTLPVNGGEKAVVRILDQEMAPRDLGELGMDAKDLRLVRSLLNRAEGVVLAAGPTGSGKSTTLFAALSEIDRERHNVVTVEDPVEYRLAGASQVHVDRRAGLGFADALRAILRQDPDVVMIGEIRDRETAEIAMAAAVTGHLVLSTIHTTDAPGAITRLLHMGVPPFLVAGGLSGVVAQRLVRSTCRPCRGRGCDECVDGMRGRTGVYQVLAVDDGMRDEISRGGSAARLRRLATDTGMRSLASDARRAAAEGLTSPHEIGRLLAADTGAGRSCDDCSTPLPAAARGCPGCGRRIRAECSCGAIVEPGWRFCPTCLRPVSRR